MTDPPGEPEAATPETPFGRGNDSSFVEAAQGLGWVTEEQIEEARREQARRAENGELLSIAQVLLKRNTLTVDQIFQVVDRAARGESGVRNRTLGRFRVLRLIGRGGMGVVYEAWDPDLQRRLALKVIRAQAGSEELAERLRREAIVGAKLHHPNIVTVHEIGRHTDEDGELSFVAMDFIEGCNLAERLPHLKLRERIEILKVLSEAVAYAHEQKVVHRDLKPQNVLLEGAGEGASRRVVLIDFGLAKLKEARELTRIGSPVGTTHYMAPEQVSGRRQRIGPWTDVWALGIMMYEMLTDRRPFAGATALDVYERILGEEPRPPRELRRETPADLQAICLRALEKDAARRHANAGEFAADLAKYLSGAPVHARPSAATRRLRSKLWLLGGPAVFVLAGVGVFVHLWGKRDAAATARPPAIDRYSTEMELAQTTMDRCLHYYMQTERPSMAEIERLMRAAIDHARAAAVERPQAPDPLVLEGRCHAFLRSLEEAEAAFTRAIAANSKSAEAFFQRARLFYHRSLSCLPAHVELARLPSVAALETPEGRSWAQKAREDADQARKLGLDTHRQNLLEAFQAFRDGYYVRASAGAEQYLEKESDDFEEYFFLGIARAGAGDFTGSVRAFDRYIGYIRSPEAYSNRARSRVKAGDFSGAVSDLQQVVAVLRDSADMYAQLGACKEKTGDLEGAIRDFEEAIRLRPDWAQLYNDCGTLRMQMMNLCGREGRHEEARTLQMQALRDFDGAIERNRDFAPAYYNRAGARWMEGDGRGALQDYEKAIRIDPTHLMAYRDRAWLRCMIAERCDHEGRREDARRERDLAMKEYGRMIEIDPKFPDGYSGTGFLKMMAGDWEGAIRDFEKALEVAPPDWSWRSQVRDALQKAREKP